jgi:hypothetical protein
MYVYAMECYSSIKEKKIMSFVGKWMELEIIMLSKIIQTQKDNYHMFFHVQNMDLKKWHEG